MKKMIFFAGIFCILSAACTKKESTPVTPATPTNPFAGSWTVVLLDNAALPSPQTGTYVTTASSSTAGTGHFDFYDGTTHNIEDASYVLSAGNTHVQFTKTGGGWTIDTLTSSVLRMTNSTGLIIKCTK